MNWWKADAVLLPLFTILKAQIDLLLENKTYAFVSDNSLYNKLKLFLLFLKLVMKLCWLFFMPRRSCECESKIFCFIFPFLWQKIHIFFFFHYEIQCNYFVPVGFFVLNDTIQILWLLSAGWIVNCCTQSETRNPTGECMVD